MILVLSLSLILFSSEKPPVSFDAVSHDFGVRTLRESELTHEFIFKNTSDRQVSVAYALASCTCTTLDWSREFIPPGQSGFVKATYNKETFSDSFNKTVSVFFDGYSSPVVLSIKGQFVATSEELLDDYPARRGPVSFKGDTLSIGTLTQGQPFYYTLFAANPTGSDARLRFKTGEGLQIPAWRESVSSCSQAFIDCVFKTDSTCWGHCLFSAVPVVNGSEQAPVFFDAVVLEDFGHVSSAERNSSAYFTVLREVLHFGFVRAGDGAYIRIPIRNDSAKDLIIRAVQADRAGVSFNSPDCIYAGKTSGIDVKIDSSALVPGHNKIKVSIVTNSPLKPFTELVVEGFVE